MSQPEITVFHHNFSLPYITDYIVPQAGGRVIKLSSFAEVHDLLLHKGSKSLDIYGAIFGHRENIEIVRPFWFISIERMFWNNKGEIIELKPQLLRSDSSGILNSTCCQLFQCENLDLLLTVNLIRDTGEISGHVIINARDPDTGKIYKPDLDDFGVILKVTNTL